MAYASFKMGGGLNLKADATAIRDDQLVRAKGCSFDLVGAVQSQRGREFVADYGAAIYGMWEGYRDGAKRRYVKAGATLFEDGVARGVLGGSNALFTGFSYDDVTYVAGGGVVRRVTGTAVESWGLPAPGYQELGANPLSSTNSQVLTLTTPADHGLATGAIIELAGLTSLNGIPASEINAQHAVTVTGPAEMTFTVATTGAAAGPVAGGGSAGFVKAGPNVAGGSGGALAAGVYRWAYTFTNGRAESNFSALVSLTATEGQKGVLTGLLPGPTGTTARRVYRTALNQPQLFFVAEIADNTTTTYDDLARLPPGASPGSVPGDAIKESDRALGSDDVLFEKRKQPVFSGLLGGRFFSQARMKGTARREAPEVVQTNLGLLADWTDHDQPPADLRTVGVFKEQAFGITENRMLAFSLTGQVEHWPIGNRVIPGRNTSERLLTWLPLGDDVILYTDRGLYRLTATGLSFEDSRLDEIESPTGLAGAQAVAALDGQAGHVFLGANGLYLFDGRTVQEVSYPIEPLLTDSSVEDFAVVAGRTNARAATLRDRLYLAYRAGTFNDRLLVVDFQNPEDPKFTVQVYAYTFLYRERDGTLLGGQGQGRVHQLDVGWSGQDDLSPWGVTTKDFGLGENNAAFALDELVLDADFGGRNAVVTVTTRGRVAQSQEIAASGSGRQRYRWKLPVWMKGNTVSVSVDGTAPVRRALYEVGFTFTPLEEP